MTSKKCYECGETHNKNVPHTKDHCMKTMKRNYANRIEAINDMAMANEEKFEW